MSRNKKNRKPFSGWSQEIVILLEINKEDISPMNSIQSLKCISFFSLDQIRIYWNKLYDLRNLVGLPFGFIAPGLLTGCTVAMVTNYAITTTSIGATMAGYPCNSNLVAFLDKLR